MNVKDVALLTRKVLNDANLYSEQAFDLMMGTAAQESNFQYLYQQGGGPGRSFWQVEPRTAQDNIQNYILARSELSEALLKACFMAGWSTNQEVIQAQLERNFAFALCMARIRYYRVKDAIPLLPEHQAAYWKQHYNTPAGSGTASEYLKNYNRFCGAWK